MRDSVQVPRGFNGVYIVILLCRLYKIQRERLLCFLSIGVYSPSHLIKNGPCCDLWRYCSMIFKPLTSWGLTVNDYISKVPPNRYIFQKILKSPLRWWHQLNGGGELPSNRGSNWSRGATRDFGSPPLSMILKWSRDFLLCSKKETNCWLFIR